MGDFTVKIYDGFVEWQFELYGSNKYSIENIVDIVCKHTNLTIVSTKQITYSHQNLDNQPLIMRFGYFLIAKGWWLIGYAIRKNNNRS